MLLDWNNLFVSAQQLGRKFADETLLSVLDDRVPNLEALSFLAMGETRRAHYATRLARAGYTAVSHVAHRIGGRTKADMDATLGAAAAKGVLIDDAEQLLLGSGDSDFVALIHYLRHLAGRPVRVVGIGVGGSVAGVLDEACDDSIRLGEDLLPLSPAQQRPRSGFSRSRGR